MNSDAVPTRTRVIVVGELNHDLVLRGDVRPRFGQAEQLLDAAEALLGGSAGITAHAFARLGRPTTLLAAVGADHNGRQLTEQLATAGVDVSTVIERSDLPTGLSVVLSSGADRAILTLPGTIATLTAPELLAAVQRYSNPLHVHVSALLLQPVLAAELAGVLHVLRARGSTISLDTNDDPTGTWRGVDQLVPLIDVLLPNRSEVIALGRNDDPRSAAAILAAEGPLVVVKDGANGAFAVTPAGEVHTASAEPAVVLDTTGAGDTFNAAFLDAWLDGKSLHTALHRGVRAGTRNIGCVGGTAGQPTRAELDADLDPTPDDRTAEPNRGKR